MSLSSKEAVVREEYSCRCRNVTINAYDITSDISTPNYERVLVGETGIHIIHHYLTIRIRDRAEPSPSSSGKLVQHLTLSCSACKTKAYRITQEISPGSEAREGPVMMSEDRMEQETLRSKTGWVEVFLGPDGCLKGVDNIRGHFESMRLSDTFSIAISHLSTPEAPTSVTDRTAYPQQLVDASRKDSSNSSSAKSNTILPVPPPLFPPPPFSPSHPVFLSLSAQAMLKSEQLREKAELDARSFVETLLAGVEKEEAILRAEVEAIWKGYREGWKEIVGRANEERSRTSTKSESPIASASVKSGIPMSIRDFTPIVPSRPEIHDADSVSPTNLSAQSGSLLSASLLGSERSRVRQTTLSVEPETAVPQTLSRSLQAVKAEHINGDRSSGDRGDILSSAFRRNMDTNVDIVSSVKWAQGEEEMKRRFGDGHGQPGERSRKRASKDLGIDAKDSEQHNVAKEKDGPDPPDTANSVQGGKESSKVTKTRKRRVTFDVKTEATAVKPSNSRGYVPPNTDDLLELFDIDDVAEVPLASKPAQLQPVPRTPSYKMRKNAVASEPEESQAMSLPSAGLMSPKDGTPKRIGRFSRRPLVGSVPDTMPLLSVSVPMNDRVLSGRTVIDPPASPIPVNITSEPMVERTPSPSPVSDNPLDPLAQAHMMNLLAASAPSHRHAWKEGGKAWQMFNQRARKHKRAKGAIAEEENEDDSSVSDEESEDEVPTESWRNPSRFASSLPVQIRPLAQYRPTTLEPKTSLTEKQGVLVPPLIGTKGKPSSAAAIRRAVYDERDRSRSIDPGPALDVSEEVEDEEVDDGNNLDRGRQRALSILQARSVVPEAGMWRSMAS